MSSSKKEGLKMLPFRSMNDFILDTSKYLPPTFNDLKRFNNRVTSNLLYYQTNYFVVSAVIFLMFLFFGSNKIFLGSIGIATTGAIILFTFDKIPQLSSIKAQYPISVIGAGVFNLFIIYLTFRSILFFVLATLVPIAVSIVHASVRSRSIKNRLNNKMEQIGAPIYSNSPMGFVLSSLGLETKDFEE